MALSKKQKRYSLTFIGSGLGFALFTSADMYFIQEDFGWLRAIAAFVYFGAFMAVFQYWLDKRKERKEARELSESKNRAE